MVYMYPPPPKKNASDLHHLEITFNLVAQIQQKALLLPAIATLSNKAVM